MMARRPRAPALPAAGVVTAGTATDVRRRSSDVTASLTRPTGTAAERAAGLIGAVPGGGVGASTYPWQQAPGADGGSDDIPGEPTPHRPNRHRRAERRR